MHDLFFSSRASFSIYAPFLSTTFHHLSDNFVIPSAQNCSVFWRRRNVPTRPFNFSNKTSSYGRGNFLTSGISDNPSVQGGQKMANEVQHPFLCPATIDTLGLALSRWTIFELAPSQRKTSTSINIYLTLHSWLLPNQQQIQRQIRSIKWKSVAVVSTPIHLSTKRGSRLSVQLNTIEIIIVIDRLHICMYL